MTFIILRHAILGLTAAVIAITGFSASVGATAIPSGDFSLEVSPSPLSATVQPGESTMMELKIRNASTKPEELKVETRSFSIAYPDQNIVISNSTPPDLAQWVSYANPTFKIEAGKSFTQKITINLPEKAGFSYPFVVVVSRANEVTKDNSTNNLRGSIAVFALVNIDKPGANRKLDLVSVKSEAGLYEYLPATITVRLHNSGNSIVQPYGNVYIQRTATDRDPIAVLPLNDGKAYVLPGMTRDFTVNWNDGFPFRKTEVKNGNTATHVDWNWNRGNIIRIGRYTTSVVAAYNDGQRDVPLIGQTGFWVIPWKIVIGGLVVLILVGLGIVSGSRRILRGSQALVRHVRRK